MASRRRMDCLEVRIVEGGMWDGMVRVFTEGASYRVPKGAGGRTRDQEAVSRRLRARRAGEGCVRWSDGCGRLSTSNAFCSSIGDDIVILLGKSRAKLLSQIRQR